MHDNQLGGRPLEEIERRLNEQAGGGDGAEAPIEPGPDWTAGVSIHPLELRFPETASCETSEALVTVFNTDARETLSILSVTTDVSSFQPRAIEEEPDAVEPGGRTKFAVTFAPRLAGAVEGTLMVITDKGSFLIKGRGVAVESPYGLQPLANVRVPPRFPHVFALEVHNPHDTPLRVVEAVSSDLFVQLAAAPAAGVDADAVFFNPLEPETRSDADPGTDAADRGPRSASSASDSHRRRASARGAHERRASTASGGGGSPFRELEALRGERLNASTLFAPTIDTSGALFAEDDETFDASWSDDARVALAFANQKLEEEDKRYRALVAELPPLPRRSDEAWTIPPGETKAVLLVRLAINRVGHFEGSVRLRMRYEERSENEASSYDVSVDRESATRTVRARVPMSATCAPGVTVSPSRLDFGVATRRSDRLRATLSLFNGAPRPARVTQIETRPFDPSLRARLENGFADGVLPASATARDAVALTYSGKLEGFRVGTLLVHTDLGESPLEVSYRARVVHGKLEFDVHEASFASPDAGRAPFPTQRKTFSIANAFPTPLAVTGARVVVERPKRTASKRTASNLEANLEDHRSDEPEACCLRVVSSVFDATQVVAPGDVVRSLEIEYEPRAVAALFDARLELTTNLTALVVPLRVYHGQLACFDAAQAATRAAAAAAAAAGAYSTVTPAGDAGERARRVAGADAVPVAAAATGIAASSEEDAERRAVPCAVSDGKYREKEGLSIMGVIDFGVTRVGDEKVRRVAVRNPNPVAIAIESVTSTVRAARVTRVEVSAAPLSAPIGASSVSALQSEAATRRTAPFRPDPPSEGCLTERGKMAACVQSFARRGGERGGGADDASDETRSEGAANETVASKALDAATPLGDGKAFKSASAVIIPPDHVATIDVLAAPEEEEMARMGGMLSFALDNGRTLVAPVVLRALRGEVAVVAESRGGPGMPERRSAAAAGGGDAPEKLGAVLATLEVPAAFPGRSTRAPLTLRSSFAEAVTVFGSASSDPAVRLEPSAEKLKPGKRVVVGEVVFDPADLDADRAYTGLARNKRTGATAYKAGDKARASSSGGASPRAERARGLLRGAAASSPEKSRGVAKGGGFFFGGFLTRLFSFFWAGGPGDGGAMARPARRRAADGAPALSSADVEEITRARDAWARVVGGENPHAASSATVESILTVRTDAVDEVRVRVRTKLIRPKMLLFSGDDDDEFARLDVEAFVDDDEADDADDAGRREGDERRKGDDSGKSAPELPNAASEDGDGDESSSSPSPVSSSRTRDSDASSGASARTARSARVVDFGSAQVGAKTRRRRVVFINPFADQSLCVRVLPMVPAATTLRGRDVRVTGGRGALDDILEAAEAHFLGERDPGGAFALEGGELASARGGGFNAASTRAARSDWTCLAPYSKIDLGALVFAPREVRPYAAHLCVRNNFTTLECATLRGDGDAVKVSVAKAKRTKKQFERNVADAYGSTGETGRTGRGGKRAARKTRLPPAVTDVAFRLPRSDATGDGIVGGDVASASSVDVMTRVIWVVNDGSAVARVSKPWIGAVECGGDGSVGGYTVSPCGAFELPPGASKRLTVVCHPEHAARAANAPGTWTQLAMDVKSADGESSRLVVQLSASARVAGGAYAAGELEKARGAFLGGFFAHAWRRAAGTAAALCFVAFGAKEAFGARLPTFASTFASTSARVADEASARKPPRKPSRGSPTAAKEKEKEKEKETDEKLTLARRRREKALEGDGAAPPALSALRTGEDYAAGSPRIALPDRASGMDSSSSPDSVMHPTRLPRDAYRAGAPGADSEASPPETPSPPADSSATAAAAAAAAARRASDLPHAKVARPEASPPQSPVPSPKAGRRHAKEVKPPTLTLSSIPKPKSPTAGSAGSADGSAPASPGAAAAFEARNAPPAEAKRAPQEKSVAASAAKPAPKPPQTAVPQLARHLPQAAPTAPVPSPPRSRPAPGSAARAPEGFGDVRLKSPSSGTAASFAPPPAPPRRAADGGWLAPPLPPRETRPLNQPRVEPGRTDGVAPPYAPPHERRHRAAGFAGYDASNASDARAFDARLSLENRRGISRPANAPLAEENGGGGWMPAPPRPSSLGPPGLPAVPAFAPAGAPGARAFGGLGGELSLLSGGALGYNMWGAPAPPAAGAGGGFAGRSSFFDGGGDDALEPPMGSQSQSQSHQRDGDARARTQESSDLDAETEWSRHNKGLLDDLGLD